MWLAFEDINNEQTFDLTCATLLMMDKAGHRFVTQMYWLPRDRFHARVHRDKIPCDKWHERGLLRLCNGNTMNYSDMTVFIPNPI